MNMADTQSATRTISFAEAIRDGLTEVVRRDPSVVVMAEGVDDPSSMFGTTKYIAKECGANRVLEIPVAENALTGVAIGLAMSGHRPVLCFQRVEFALLALEQIFNNAAKAHYISNGQHRVPLVIRLIVGRGWGQGPEHSQSLEAIFSYFPGLKVVMPAFPQDAKGLIVGAVEDDNPVVFIEHRWCHYATGEVPAGYYSMPLDGPRVIEDGDDVTIVSSSYMSLEALRAAGALREIGYSAQVFDLRVLRPLETDAIIQSVKRTGRLLTVDTGWRKFGIGAEIVAQVATAAHGALRAAPVRLGLPDHPTPSSRGMVRGFYPNAEDMVHAAGQLLGVPTRKVRDAVRVIEENRKDLPADIPDPFFKGPF